jgi:hypothetical protein
MNDRRPPTAAKTDFRRSAVCRLRSFVRRQNFMAQYEIDFCLKMSATPDFSIFSHLPAVYWHTTVHCGLLTMEMNRIDAKVTLTTLAGKISQRH